MARSLRKPNLPLKADHFEVVRDHTYDLPCGSGYEAAEISPRLYGFL